MQVAAPLAILQRSDTQGAWRRVDPRRTGRAGCDDARWRAWRVSRTPPSSRPSCSHSRSSSGSASIVSGSRTGAVALERRLGVRFQRAVEPMQLRLVFDSETAEPETAVKRSSRHLPGEARLGPGAVAAQADEINEMMA